METEKSMAVDASSNKEEKSAPEEPKPPYLKIAVIGEKGVGKSSLIVSAMKDAIIPHPDERLAPKTYCLDLEVNGETKLCLAREGDAKESKIFTDSDVALLCITRYRIIMDGKSRFQQLKKLMPNVPIVPVAIEKNVNMSVENGGYSHHRDVPAPRYCCPLSGKGVKSVFRQAVFQFEEHLIYGKRENV